MCAQGQQKKKKKKRWRANNVPAGDMMDSLLACRAHRRREGLKKEEESQKKKNKREEGKMNCLWNSPPIINREREQSGQFSLSFSFPPLLAGHHAVLYIARQKRSTYRWKSIFPLFMETKREREKSPCDLSLCLHCGLSCSVKRGFHRAEKRPSIS